MSEKNLLTMVPERIAVETDRIDGCARIEFPRFRSAPGRLFGRIFQASEKIKLTLDDKSTVVWDLVDGRRTVEQIGRELQRRYGRDLDPLYHRLGQLLAVMEKNRLIRYRPM